MPTRDYHHEHFKTLDSIAIPSISRTIGVSLCLGTAALIAFLILTPWVQTTQGPGRVTALNPNDRLQDINALVTGRIQEWFVRDGSRVQMGDPIVRIVDNDPNLLDRLNAEREQVVAKQEAAVRALRTAEIDTNRMRELFDQGLAARREYERRS